MKRIGQYFLFLSLLLTPHFAWAAAVTKTATKTTTAAKTAAGAAGATSTTTSTTSWMIPDWAEKLLKKLDDMWTTMQDLMSGKLIKDAITKFVVGTVDDFMAPMLNGFAKSYLFTPRVAEMDFVHTGWTIFSIIGLCLLILGIGVLVIQVVKGKKQMKTLLQVFIVCFVLIFASLTMINTCNVGLNWIVQEGLSGMLKTKNINFQGLDGKQIIKSIVIGIQAINDPAYAAKTPGEIISQTEGGMFTLLGVVFLIIFPLWLVTVAKVVVLIILAIFVAVWITITAYTGKYEILIGWINLYLRTLAVGLLIAWHWGIFVKSQSDYGTGMGLATDIGVSPTTMAYLTVVALLIFLYFFWIKPIFTAVKDPITLGGGKVIEQLGAFSDKTSKVVGGMGKRLGLEDMQRMSLSWSTKSKELSEYGRRLQTAPQGNYLASKFASRATGGLSEVIQGVEYQPMSDEEWMNQNGSIIRMEEQPLDQSSLVVSGVELKDLSIALRKKGFTQGALLSLQGAQKKKMNELLRTSAFAEKFGENFSWDSTTGTLFMKNHIASLMEDLEEANISTDKSQHVLYKDNVYVDLKTRQVQSFGDPNELHAFASDLKDELPVYRQIHLPSAEAEKAYQGLLSQEQRLPWVKRLRWEADQKQLLVPEDLLPQMNQELGDHLKTPTSYTRVDMPKGSHFLGNMVQEFKNQAVTNSWIHAAIPETEKNHLFIREDHLKEFQEAFEAYRDQRIPYWTTKDGKIKVVKDGVPVDYGSVPLLGMNMGSFEALQNQALWKHSTEKKKGKEE
jgi:hypothetical protein